MDTETRLRIGKLEKLIKSLTERVELLEKGDPPHNPTHPPWFRQKGQLYQPER